MAKVSFFTISDIHLGVGGLDPQYQWDNLIDNFFYHCDIIKPDVIFVAGDIMDERVSVNSSTALVFHMFIDKLIETGSTIVIVEGTKSHDDNQISVFSHRVCDKFRIYSRVASDTIHGMKILFIPEEYMSDPTSYYKDYLNKNYDHVIGHGMFDHVAYTGKKKQIFRKLTSPMWNYEKDFKRITKGVVNFGHVHTHQILDRFAYNGSFGRYNHGEEEPKGFMHYIYDASTTSIEYEFIENNGAKIFKTVLESDLPLGRDLLMDKLKSLSESSYRLRIRFDREVDPTRWSDIVSFAKSNLNSTIDNKYGRKIQKENKLAVGLDSSNVVENKYEKMDIVEATMEFVMEKHGIKIDKSHILKVINGDKND